MNTKFLYLLLLVTFLTSCSQSKKIQRTDIVHQSVIESSPAPLKEVKIRPGAERTRHYFNKLKHDKRVAVVANQTSMIEDKHLVDSLLKEGINVVKVFTPEHGFRGFASNGEIVNSEIDPSTGLPIISLYGNHKKPNPESLKDVDIVVFDLQDVGVRFYTYISTLTLVMEACAELNIPLLVLDRPNPNGFYVDGPVLKTEFKSFIGMHPVPVVHGMTIAEYARMVNEEGWLTNGIKCELEWVECSGYNHRSFYHLPIRPSPNLPDQESVILYPSICFFEGTIVSVGRGTDSPFTIIGYPDYLNGDYSFTPISRQGALNPPYDGQLCKGHNMRHYADSIRMNPGIRLDWLINMYKSDTSQKFFTSFFTKLAGTDLLRKQIESGLNEYEIKESWQQELNHYMELRSKYILYRDFPHNSSIFNK